MLRVDCEALRRALFCQGDYDRLLAFQGDYDRCLVCQGEYIGPKEP